MIFNLHFLRAKRKIFLDQSQFKKQHLRTTFLSRLWTLNNFKVYVQLLCDLVPISEGFDHIYHICFYMSIYLYIHLMS